MKNQLTFRFIFLVLISVFLSGMLFQNITAQNSKKNNVRIVANFFKIMDNEVFFEIRAISRINRKNTAVTNIDISMYNEFGDESILLGKSITNMNGECRFSLENMSKMRSDSTGAYNMKFLFKGNKAFKKATKNIQFKNAAIEAKLIVKDSVNYLNAFLKDLHTEEPLSDESLVIKVQRLFRPLTIGEEFNYTDENGKIMVTLEEGIPGVDGILTFEVVLEDHDDFGTVIALVTAPVGIPYVEESTFDERTMWSPRNKTPLFLLIIPNVLTFGMWAIIVYLCLNLIKIFKS